MEESNIIIHEIVKCLHNNLVVINSFVSRRTTTGIWIAIVAVIILVLPEMTSASSQFCIVRLLLIDLNMQFSELYQILKALS